MIIKFLRFWEVLVWYMLLVSKYKDVIYDLLVCWSYQRPYSSLFGNRHKYKTNLKSYFEIYTHKWINVLIKESITSFTIQLTSNWKQIIRTGSWSVSEDIHFMTKSKVPFLWRQKFTTHALLSSIKSDWTWRRCSSGQDGGIFKHFWLFIHDWQEGNHEMHYFQYWLQTRMWVAFGLLETF